jgi:hypothetical protein
MIAVLGLAGCARQQAEPWAHTVPAHTAPKSSPVIVTPTEARSGKVTSVNSTVRYVVITYPVGVPMPAPERKLNVYRAGLKVAEVKAGGDNLRERRDVNLTADIVAGECQVGDEVRED